MKKLAMMFVMIVGFAACDGMTQDDVPGERVAPLSSGEGGVEPSPAPDPNRPDPGVRWMCGTSGAICIDRISLETVADGYCEGYNKPECKHLAK